MADFLSFMIYTEMLMERERERERERGERERVRACVRACVCSIHNGTIISITVVRGLVQIPHEN